MISTTKNSISITLQKMTSKHDNPWEVNSLYVFQYFNCPSCTLKVASKQDFVYHAFSTHPESIEDFKKISDGSLCDILLPWENDNIIKIELKDDDSKDQKQDKSDLLKQKVNSSCALLSEIPSQEILFINADDSIEELISEKQPDVYNGQQSNNVEDFCVETIVEDKIEEENMMQHSSEKRGLRSTFLSSVMLQNLLYL